MRGPELFDHPEWIGQEVVIDVYEPLRTSAQTSAAGPGELSVGLESGGRLKLVPGELDPLGPLRPPLRVSGVLGRARHGLQIAVSEVSELDMPEPEKVASAAGLTAEPARWQGRYVVVEGTWVVGFEASYLDRETWVSLYPDATIRCKPLKLPEYKPTRVRLTGFVYTEGGHFGHLGLAKAEIVATELVYLDPRAPGCTP